MFFARKYREISEERSFEKKFTLCFRYSSRVSGRKYVTVSKTTRLLDRHRVSDKTWNVKFMAENSTGGKHGVTSCRIGNSSAPFSRHRAVLNHARPSCRVKIVDRAALTCRLVNYSSSSRDASTRLIPRHLGEIRSIFNFRVVWIPYNRTSITSRRLIPIFSNNLFRSKKKVRKKRCGKKRIFYDQCVTVFWL